MEGRTRVRPFLWGASRVIAEDAFENVQRFPMDTRAIFLPALAMVALTFLVWCRLYVVRIAQIHRGRIDPQAVATSAQAAARLTDTRASDNFRNLFELPVLFYVAVGVIAISGMGGAAALALAWLFVVLRVVHSVIHCSYNRVMHRLFVHASSTLVLWALWAVIGMELIRA